MNARCGTRCTPAHLKTALCKRAVRRDAGAGGCAEPFMARCPQKYLRYDMTENKLYSLSQETEGPVRGLNAGRNVLLPRPYRPGGCGRHRAAGQVQRRFIHIQVVQKDPVLYPTLARRRCGGRRDWQFIAVCGERYRVVDAGDLYTYTPNHQTYTYDTEFDGRGALTSALPMWPARKRRCCTLSVTAKPASATSHGRR